MNMKDGSQQKQNDESSAGKLWSKPELKVLQACSEDIKFGTGAMSDAFFASSTS
ncbi:hypothetical protein ACR9YC_08815 [Parasphingorhabdus sp. DH2-15]|uniref:hypothetical protein n=1 Tax=Parasphingorhabdus sp. DH2-15 TaxID=3444112 RepID=UPI003F682CBA